MTNSRLQAGFKAFFDNVLQRPVLQAQAGKPLFEEAVLDIKLFNLFNIRNLHATVSGLSVVVGGFRNTGLLADIFNSSSGFNRLNHGVDLMLSKTGFTHSDLLNWRVEYVGGSLNVNCTIIRDTYNTALR